MRRASSTYAAPPRARRPRPDGRPRLAHPVLPELLLLLGLFARLELGQQGRDGPGRPLDGEWPESGRRGRRTREAGQNKPEEKNTDDARSRLTYGM